MQKIGILLLFFQLAIGTASYAQDKTPEVDWQKVEIRIIESRKTPRKLDIMGESTLKITQRINAVSDLNEEQLMEMKKKAAKDGCKLVGIDTKGVYDSPKSPTFYSKGKLYYYWGKEK
ncbi:hypothetical protein [Fluviicola taffensis]|uniref:hypothetical protein n=1 Tax=Fluviicola taffensis TaxID=191579 RepID=UPI003137BECA